MRGHVSTEETAMTLAGGSSPYAMETPQDVPAVGDRTSKRLMDLLLLLVAFPLVLPFVLLVALAIRLDSPGPVLFRQERIGFKGRPFRMWKFRSMVPNADRTLAEYLARNPSAHAEWKATQKLKYDPRVTRLGRFLRRSSLDELPQLWNVLTGDMSLVGPRPIVPGEQLRYGPAYQYYLQTRPGLTGLWQVSGRNDTSYAQRIELDARYVRQWKLGLDGAIVFKTVGVVLRGNGAY